MLSKISSQNCREWLKNGLCALLPGYDEFGTNGTEILFESGKRIRHKRKLRSVLKELARTNQKDITMIRENAAQILGQKTMLPISISPCLTLVPFKVRKPVGEHDGSLGYILDTAIMNIEKTDQGSIIKIKGGFEILAFENIKTAKRHIENADRIRKTALQNGLRNEQLSLALHELHAEYERPATRGDIALLSRSLLSLIEKLGM